MNSFSHRGRPPGRLQFFEQALDVRLDGSFGYTKLVADVFVALAFGNKFYNVQFTPAQYRAAHILHQLLPDSLRNTRFADMRLPDRIQQQVDAGYL